MLARSLRSFDSQNPHREGITPCCGSSASAFRAGSYRPPGKFIRLLCWLKRWFISGSLLQRCKRCATQNQTHAQAALPIYGDALNLGGRQSHVQSKLFMDSMIISCVQAARNGRKLGGFGTKPADIQKSRVRVTGYWIIGHSSRQDHGVKSRPNGEPSAYDFGTVLGTLVMSGSQIRNPVYN